MRKKERTPRQLKLEGAATFGLYLVDVMLVASIVSCIICGTHSTVARLFTIETFALGIIGMVLVLVEQHKIEQEDEEA
jgi:predicted membrane channel-forming protein YqfA (hemolysin III family)